jgi:hypothetical protein
MGKSAVLSVGGKMCVPVENNILVQDSKILPAVSPIYDINPSMNLEEHTVSIFSPEAKILRGATSQRPPSISGTVCNFPFSSFPSLLVSNPS